LITPVKTFLLNKRTPFATLVIWFSGKTLITPSPKRGFLGKQMLDGGFGQLGTITQYICWKRGKFFGVVDARGTSGEGLLAGLR
jgi:hypothetical protein